MTTTSRNIRIALLALAAVACAVLRFLGYLSPDTLNGAAYTAGVVVGALIVVGVVVGVFAVIVLGLRFLFRHLH
jgi:quinol-cytochrome oxidoreductase complex cytochrome b subunit